MRHRVFGRKLNRNFNQRKALLRSLLSSFIDHGKIVTTKAKAKFFQPVAERLVSGLIKKNDLASLKRVQLQLQNPKLTKKLSDKAKEFVGRVGGYTMIKDIDVRRGDKSRMVQIEWMSNEKN
ncbi:50S ribosomal protein L17 [Candidatus Collierbacteria bacterium]|nr:50S ribosomal protein L17 [Candidatus Collierbacteria bacterium]